MDGGLHLDEVWLFFCFSFFYSFCIFFFFQILIKLDHLTGIPASPNYALDDVFLSSSSPSPNFFLTPPPQKKKDYFTQRVKQTPWVAQHLRNQQNSSYWNNDSLSRENLMVPIYFVGGEMYPFVDYAIDIASEVWICSCSYCCVFAFIREID